MQKKYSRFPSSLCQRNRMLTWERAWLRPYSLLFPCHCHQQVSSFFHTFYFTYYSYSYYPVGTVVQYYVFLYPTWYSESLQKLRDCTSEILFCFLLILVHIYFKLPILTFPEVPILRTLHRRLLVLSPKLYEHQPTFKYCNPFTFYDFQSFCFVTDY